MTTTFARTTVRPATVADKAERKQFINPTIEAVHSSPNYGAALMGDIEAVCLSKVTRILPLC